MSKRAVVYTRVSTTAQEDNFSLGSQEASCRRFASERGWSVICVEQDVASGANRHRPGLERALTVIERGEGDVLLAHALDRISRHQIDVAVIVDRVEAARGTLALCTEDFEQSPVGTFIRSARAFAAEIELAKISAPTARGRQARLASGKPLAGRRPVYGYQWADADKSRLELNTGAAPIVRSVKERYVCGNLHCRKVTIATAAIDDAVWNLVRRVLTDPDLIRREIDRAKSDGTCSLRSEIAAVERLLAETAAKQRNAAKAIVAIDDEEIAAPVREELRLLSERRKSLEAELATLEQSAASIHDEQSRLIAFGEWAQRVSANLDTLTYEERRMALEALAVSVEVFQVEDSEHPRWRVTMRPSPDKNGEFVLRYA